LSDYLGALNISCVTAKNRSNFADMRRMQRLSDAVPVRDILKTAKRDFWSV